jgi:hypothetical protein
MSEQKNDGGPAFPGALRIDQLGSAVVANGMSLRAYIATAIHASMVSGLLVGDQPYCKEEDVALVAVAHTDALIAELAK